MNEEKTSENMRKMISLVNKLRGDGGCPWLKKQDLKKQFNEFKSEVKELENAIVNNDINNLREELGDVFWDLLMLIVFSEEEYDFKIENILDNTSQKIIRRKPYVFGDEKAETPEEAIAIWNRIKKEEKLKNLK